MPYRKRPYKKTTRRKTTNRRKVYGAAGMQLYKDVKMLKNLINVEFKKHDVYNSVNVNNTGSFVLLNGLSNGDDYNDRDGRQVRFKSIQVQTRTLLNPSSTNTVFRMILFIDKQANAGSPAVTELLDVATAARTDAFRNLDYRKRYVILKDKRFTVNSDYPEKIVDFYKRLDMKTIFDDSSTGTINDISSNSLYLYFVSDEVTNTPAILYNSRLRFIDN